MCGGVPPIPGMLSWREQRQLCSYTTVRPKRQYRTSLSAACPKWDRIGREKKVDRHSYSEEVDINKSLSTFRFQEI
jgi:hypothetical protein